MANAETTSGALDTQRARPQYYHKALLECLSRMCEITIQLLFKWLNTKLRKQALGLALGT